MKNFFVCFICYSLTNAVFSESINKYSAEANVKDGSSIDLEASTNIRSLEKPFRMAKLNILWTKAQLRLTEPKLKSLFSDLKIQDKEEIILKRLKSEGGDKNGMKEAELRKKLLNIMTSFGLLEHFEDLGDHKKVKDHNLNDPSHKYVNKALFKDKKLNQLWTKAEKSGFTVEELQALKEEFEHHQDKIDEYYSILKNIEESNTEQAENSVDEKLDLFNTLNSMEEEPQSKYNTKANKLRDKHQEIRDGYDRLYRVAAKGPKSKEFIEPKVQGLWKLAMDANFTPDELESLRSELLHYENRLLKLRHLHAEAELNAETRAAKLAGEKPPEGLLLMADTIKKHARKVEKLHLDLETRIMRKHIEL